MAVWYRTLAKCLTAHWVFIQPGSLGKVTWKFDPNYPKHSKLSLRFRVGRLGGVGEVNFSPQNIQHVLHTWTPYIYFALKTKCLAKKKGAWGNVPSIILMHDYTGLTQYLRGNFPGIVSNLQVGKNTKYFTKSSHRPKGKKTTHRSKDSQRWQ